MLNQKKIGFYWRNTEDFWFKKHQRSQLVMKRKSKGQIANEKNTSGQRL